MSSICPITYVAGFYRQQASLGLSKDEAISQVATATLKNTCAFQANNGDFDLSNKVTAGIFLGVNVIGIIRQIISLADNALLIKVCRHLRPLTQLGQGVSSALDGLNAFSAGGLGLAGLGNVWASRKSIKDAYKKLIKAWTAAETVFKNKTKLQGDKLQVGLTAIKSNFIRAVGDTEAELSIAIAGMANHILYLLMGLGQTASGVLSWLGPTVAHLFHYTAVLSGPVASAAAKASGIAMGAIFIIRGFFMAWRATESVKLVKDFKKEFTEVGTGTEATTSVKIERLMDFMRDTEDLAKKMDSLDEVVEDAQSSEQVRAGTDSTEKEKMGLGQGYLERRFSSEFMKEKDEQGNVITYTAEGIVGADGGTTEYVNNAQKIHYLKAVDKGIYNEKLKHRIGQIIAVSMIVGGILTLLAACVFTGGIAPLIIGLVSAVFFTCMEGAFMSYDSSTLFAKLRDKLYSEPQWLKDLEFDVENPFIEDSFKGQWNGWAKTVPLIYS